MKPRQLLYAVLLAGTALAWAPWPPAQAQTSEKYEIRHGDTLFAIARRFAKGGLTRNQMLLAIYRANKEVFAGGNINLLDVGAVLVIPGHDDAAKISSAEADREVTQLLAIAPASAMPSTAATRAPKATPGAVPLTPAAAAGRYEEGIELERKGDHRGALAAFLQAGEAGNGLAQRKLGQIYDKGSPATERDYATALKWYQKAREQGVDVDQPLLRRPPPSGN